MIYWRQVILMKYILLSAAALIIIFGLSFLITGLIRKKLKKKPPMALHILISLCAAIIVIGAGCFAYLSIYTPAQDVTVEAFANSGGAKVSKIDGGYFVDGTGDDTALVFYPGAKIDSKAYLPLMKQLADGGIDCFLLEVPMHMAIFDMNAADKITDNYKYDTLIVSGHSMGGVAAAKYAADHDTVDGVVLLASYPTTQLPDSTALLSVYGTEDKELELNKYEESKKNFPSNSREIIIEGGNHAQFGNYGEQSGDGTATISREEQQSQTAKAILEFAKKIS